MGKITKLLPIIGLLVFVYILSKISIGTLAESFKNINPSYFLIAILLSVPALFVKTAKWLTLIKPFKADYGIFAAAKTMLVGLFIGLITPARIGDFSRSFYLKEKTSLNFGSSLATVVFDRVIDIAVLFLLALLGLFSLARIYSMDRLIWVIAAAFVLFIAAIFLFLNESMTKRILKPLYNIFVPEKYKGKLTESFYEFYKGTGVLRNFTTSLLLAGIVSVLGWIITFLQYYLVAAALNISINFIFIAMIMPVVMLVEILPISFSGIGTRDATLILFLGFAGVAAGSAVALSIGILLLNYIFASFGLLFWMKNPIKL